MTFQIQTDRGKGGTLRRKSGLWWIFGRQLADLRSLIAIFMFLFLLVMPIAMLILGRDIFTELANRHNVPYHEADGMTVVYYLGIPLRFNRAFFSFHLIVVTLSSVAVLVMGGSLFRPLYRRETVDFEWSLPLTKSQWFLGRALALVVGLSLVYLVNIIATSGIVYVWGLNEILGGYLLVYLKTYLSAIAFTGFSLVFFSLVGRLFDAIVLNIMIHLASPLMLLIMSNPYYIGDIRKQSSLHKLVWLFAPAFDTYREIAMDRNFLYYVILIVFWFVFGWFCAMKRPAEWGGRKSGSMRWFRSIQTFFSVAGGIIAGNLFYAFDFTSFQLHQTKLLRPAFIIGAILGAFLGQLISSAITGKTLQRVPSERTAKRRLHPVLYEWLWSLLGVVILYAVELVSQVI
ncbi:MAG: hypothetical protein KBB98_01365 [Clostridia bacterium]|nr:hypothetical protein [Clostridia bacterium]